MTEFIVNCYRENRISAKTGNSYQVLVLEFDNGYKLEQFLSNEQQFILSNVPLINK